MVRSLVGDGVKAVPHDLFKVLKWESHTDRDLIEREFEKIKGRYLVSCKGFEEGKDEPKTLERIIECHHHGRMGDGFWERSWSTADRLSTVAGRFRLEYDYWYAKQADPFFVRVYGDVREWSGKDREELHKLMMNILMRCSEKADEKSDAAFEQINECLTEFPADSRFPFTSLKTHHWLTHAIYYNESFWKEMKVAGENKREPVFENVYMVRVSIAEPEFHKLKELRGFRDNCSRILQSAKEKLGRWFPLRVGDDLYLLCLSHAEVSEVRQILARTASDFSFDLDVYGWAIRREPKAVGPDGGEETIYIVDKSDLTFQNVVAYEKSEEVRGKLAEYAKILGGEYEYVAWVCLRPRGNLKQISKKFLENSEEILGKRERKSLVETVDVRGEFLSLELALSIAEGYEEFLVDCAKAINHMKPEEGVIMKSFGESWFVSAIDEPSDAFRIYTVLSDKKAKLHMPATLVVAAAKPKYPFWRILELSKSIDVDCLAFIVGEKMVQLTGQHARLIDAVKSSVQHERKRQFYRIVNAACRDDKEVLKVKIEGFANERRLDRRTAFKLCWIVDEVARQCKGDEGLRKQITCEIFKILRMFTR